MLVFTDPEAESFFLNHFWLLISSRMPSDITALPATPCSSAQHKIAQHGTTQYNTIQYRFIGSFTSRGCRFQIFDSCSLAGSCWPQSRPRNIPNLACFSKRQKPSLPASPPRPVRIRKRSASKARRFTRHWPVHPLPALINFQLDAGEFILHFPVACAYFGMFLEPGHHYC